MESNDEAEFRAFVDSRSRALLYTARLLTADGHAAEDLVQEALARLVPQWRRVEDPNAYVQTTMHRLQISRWRRRAVVREDAVGSPPDRPTGDLVGRVHDRLVLAQALGQLSKRQRSVLVCRYVEDLDERETARRLGITIGSVRSIGHRALARLRLLYPDLAAASPAATPDSATPAEDRAPNEKEVLR